MLKLEKNFQNYLNNTELLPIKYEEPTPYEFRIQFSDEVSQEQFARIKEFLHIKPAVRMMTKVSAEKGREFVSSEDRVACIGDTICIYMPHFRVFYNVYELLKSFGVKIDGATFSSTDLSFAYRLRGRSVLNYDELGQIQNEIDPKIEHHDSCRQMGCNNEYSLSIRFDRKS